MAADSIPTGSDRFVSTQPIPARDPQIRNGPPAEAKRLCAQSVLILRMFAADNWFHVSNHALATVALKYTARISDLRAAGHQITVKYRDNATGRVVYEYQGWECPLCHAGGGHPLTMAVHPCGCRS